MALSETFVQWRSLGVDYPGEDKTIRAVFDVLAPISGKIRIPLYEFTNGIVPTVEQVWTLAAQCGAAALRTL